MERANRTGAHVQVARSDHAGLTAVRLAGRGATAFHMAVSRKHQIWGSIRLQAGSACTASAQCGLSSGAADTRGASCRVDRQVEDAKRT